MEAHGTAIDSERKKVMCHYCEKVVSGFNRLKHHLGGVGHDVVACSKVPEDVKERMRNALLEHKKGKMMKEMDRLTHPDLPLKRNLSLPSAQDAPAIAEGKQDAEAGGSHVGGSQSYLHSSQKGKQFAEFPGMNASGNGSWNLNASHKGKQVAEAAGRNFCYLYPSSNGKQVTESSRQNARWTIRYASIGRDIVPVMEQVGGSSLCSHCTSDMQETKHAAKMAMKNDAASVAERSIGKFIFDAGIDPGAVQLPSFKNMIDAVIACGAGIAIPTDGDVRGALLDEEVEEIRRHAEGLRRCWQETGCSLLLDSWKSPSGRSFMSVLAHCSQGTLFWKSLDVSDIANDVDELELVLCQIVEEIGADNVVQVITNDASAYMQAAQHRVKKKHWSVFWTVCADFCINLILEKFAELDHFHAVLTKARHITRFIYSHSVSMTLKDLFVQGRELLSSSNLKFVAQFVTLENLVSEKNNLVNMFDSPAWMASNLASRPWCKHIPEVIKYDYAFWLAAADIVKVTKPLIAVLHSLGAETCPMGIIYDAMDNAKEAIKQDLGDQGTRYMEFWVIIDTIWDNYLHSSLHSAGYFLNPRLFYSPQFLMDGEVNSGILECIARLAGAQHDQDKVFGQLDIYRQPVGEFGTDLAVEQRTKMPPVLWWSLFGGSSPGLRQLAIRILSQTCCGASRYKLDRGVTEQLHAVKRSCREQKRFIDMEYVYYNRLLSRSVPGVEGSSGVLHGKPIQLDDWISD